MSAARASPYSAAALRIASFRTATRSEKEFVSASHRNVKISKSSASAAMREFSISAMPRFPSFTFPTFKLLHNGAIHRPLQRILRSAGTQRRSSDRVPRTRIHAQHENDPASRQPVAPRRARHRHALRFLRSPRAAPRLHRPLRPNVLHCQATHPRNRYSRRRRRTAPKCPLVRAPRNLSPGPVRYSPWHSLRRHRHPPSRPNALRPLP